MINYNVPELLKYQSRCYDKPVSYLSTLDDKYVVQLKADGWWCLVLVQNGLCTVYNVGGRLLWSAIVPELGNDNGVLIGEAGYGTNWALSHFNSMVYVHDIIWWESKDYTDRDYQERVAALDIIFFDIAHGRETDLGFMSKLHRYSVDDIPELWQAYVIGPESWEGIVVKSVYHKHGEDFLRCKKQVTIDYVCMGIVEGGGRLHGKAGALVGGLYVNGILTPICSIGGGMTDIMRARFWDYQQDYLGKVFEARGAALFESGALRHPQFSHWRTDGKLPEQCVLGDNDDK